MFLCSCGQIFGEKLKISCCNILHIFYPFIALCVLTLDLARATLLSGSSNKARLNICRYECCIVIEKAIRRTEHVYPSCILCTEWRGCCFISQYYTDIMLTTGSYEAMKGCSVRKRRHLDITCEVRWRRTV